VRILISTVDTLLRRFVQLALRPLPLRRCGLASLLALAIGASTAAAQSISVDTLPAYGTLGSITGTVGGVDPNLHHVAVYIQIEGAGWWTKPSTISPTVPIGPTGSFSADVGTGGAGSLDSRATIFCAALLPDTTPPPLASGAGRIPAALSPLAIHCLERYGRTLEFAGYTWAVKEAPLPVGPGGNVFSDRVEDVFVDLDGLHLRVAFHDGHWQSTEVILLAHLGYGTYAVKTNSELDDLDVNLTFGIFTWDAYGDDERVPGTAHREIDFEDSRWTNASDPTNAQMVVQPFTAPDNLRRYTLPDLSADAALTRFFSWGPDSIEFVALTGHHSPSSFPEQAVVDEYLYLHDPPARHVPSAGRESLRLNLWLNNVAVGGPGPPQPAGGQAVEVVITDVVYVPEPGAALLQAVGLAALAVLSGCPRARGHSPDGRRAGRLRGARRAGVHGA
jgi:hypothetical protein